MVQRLSRELESLRGYGIFIVEDGSADGMAFSPHEVMEAKLELAERFLEEAKGFMEKEDPVQASEKLYKVAEECVEIPAEALRRARAS